MLHRNWQIWRSLSRKRAFISQAIHHWSASTCAGVEWRWRMQCSLCRIGVHSAIIMLVKQTHVTFKRFESFYAIKWMSVVIFIPVGGAGGWPESATRTAADECAHLLTIHLPPAHSCSYRNCSSWVLKNEMIFIMKRNNIINWSTEMNSKRKQINKYADSINLTFTLKCIAAKYGYSNSI